MTNEPQLSIAEVLAARHAAAQHASPRWQAETGRKRQPILPLLGLRPWQTGDWTCRGLAPLL